MTEAKTETESVQQTARRAVESWQAVAGLVGAVVALFGGGAAVGGALRSGPAQNPAELEAAAEARATQRAEEAKQRAVLEYQLTELVKKVDGLGKKLDEAARSWGERLEVRTADRLTATAYKEAEARRDAQELERRQQAEQRQRAVEEHVRSLEAQLRAHQAEPWHTQAGAEHAETKRRVDRLENRLGALEAKRAQ